MMLLHEDDVTQAMCTETDKCFVSVSTRYYNNIIWRYEKIYPLYITEHTCWAIYVEMAP